MTKEKVDFVQKKEKKNVALLTLFIVNAFSASY